MLHIKFLYIWIIGSQEEEISEYLEFPFMRRRFFKIDKILHLFDPYWAPIGASPLIFLLFEALSHQRTTFSKYDLFLHIM